MMMILIVVFFYTATTKKSMTSAIVRPDETRDRYANKKQPQGVALIVMENATSLEYSRSSRIFPPSEQLGGWVIHRVGSADRIFLKDRSPTSPAISGALGLAAGVMITVV